MKVFKRLGLLILILLLIGSIGTSIYFYLQSKKSTEAPNSKELETITAEIGKFMDLPEEIPSLATITDKTKLTGQPFFTRAENGDKVLIYVKAQKAILFRPSMHKIIDVAPINLNDPKGSPEGTSKTASNATVALYNGTKSTGITTTVQKQIEAGLPDLVVKARENAKKNTYTSTIVVDIAGTRTAEAEALATLLNGSVEVLPDGETTPASDLLVIVGRPAAAIPTVEPTSGT